MSTPTSPRSGWTVRTRLMVGICLIVALGIAAAGSTAFLIERAHALTALDEHLTSRMAAARAIVLGAADAGDPSAPAQAFASSDSAARAVVAGIVPDTGESTFAMVNGKVAYIPGIPTTIQLSGVTGLPASVISETSPSRTVLASVTTPSGVYRYIAAPITVAGDSTPAVFVMGASVDQALAGVYSQAATFAVVSAVTFLVVVALGWFISGRLLWPIVVLTRTAERITSRNRSERVDARGNDDLSRLGRVVNGMLDRLDAELVRQRQLLDDVRHELNTPLTILRGHLELLDIRDLERVSATRALSLDELSRMTELVSDLTRLAESEETELALEDVDVPTLTRDVSAKAGALSDHVWRVGASDAGSARVDRRKITEAWLQLLENASKYAPAGSVIALGSTATDDAWQLWVVDQGPGVPEEARERIFERFGRVGSNRGVRGSGLGLPIVRAIARAHGGDVTHEPAGTGSRFTIIIPRNALGEERTP